MARIELDRPVREALARDLSRYLKDEFGVEAGGMEMVLMIDFLSERLGPHYYNRALADAQAVLQGRLEQIGEAIDGLAKPTGR